MELCRPNIRVVKHLSSTQRLAALSSCEAELLAMNKGAETMRFRSPARECGNRIRLCAQNKRKCIVGSHQQARLRKDAPRRHARIVGAERITNSRIVVAEGSWRKERRGHTHEEHETRRAREKHLAEMVFIKATRRVEARRSCR